MIRIRKSEERHHVQHDWLNGYHTFSFGNYRDPEYAGFRVLRVLNDDRIAAGKGFGPHAHRDMEIITYVVEGRVRHLDSTGQLHVLGPNQVQAMSAGTGVVHSEFNASESELARVMQIWIEPVTEDLDPSYQQVAFDAADKRKRFRLLAAPEPDASLPATVIHQDARVYVAEVKPGETAKYMLASGRYAWLQAVRGRISLNGEALKEGDGAAVSNEQQLEVAGNEGEGGEVLLFDLP